MTSPTLTRSRARALVGASAFGSLVGLAIGCAYLGGAVARATSVREQAARIEQVMSQGGGDQALTQAVGGLDSSALAIARRHDPYTVAGAAERDRQAALIAARLERRGSPSQSQAAGLRPIPISAAPAFRMQGALDASRDLECLTQAVYYEARGEGASGMQAVAQVILNRVRHPAFPRTVCGVVYQGSGRRTGCQFSFTCDGSMRGRVQPAAWSRARQVASRALSGAVYAQVGNATHFHTTAVSPAWRHQLVRVNQVGAHVFYRFGGGRRSGGSYLYQPDLSAPQQPRTLQAGLDGGVVQAASERVAYTILHGAAEAVNAAQGQTSSQAPSQGEGAPAAQPQQAQAAPAPSVTQPRPAAPTVTPASTQASPARAEAQPA
ncbi:cell wall hydrolase [Brevundimonas sp. 2R-24]|uniref:Cell wall hydrolase n=1 Tax=Peiella sedimenti TaxID=3061083 RepID=A0ABT8SI85_9CAUL|nr:cell wall hydrolase [Caulobacteraceae bacterium XZ-24]